MRTSASKTSAPERRLRRGPQQDRNRLLGALPAAEYERLAPHLVPVALATRQVISDPDERPRHVYFPETAVLSMVVIMADGTAVEAATVGNEGMAGLSALLGTASMTTRCLAQVAGQARRMTAPALRRAVTESPVLQARLRCYTQAFINQVAQTAACNRLHSIGERCARWLLMTHDRVGDTDAFDLTQEFLSYMLGVRREGVSGAAHLLQAAGLIRYGRGRIVILDRARLETAACECYHTGQADYARLLG